MSCFCFSSLAFSFLVDWVFLPFLSSYLQHATCLKELLFAVFEFFDGSTFDLAHPNEVPDSLEFERL